VVNEVCTYKPGGEVVIAVNGVAAVTATTDANGCVAPTITIASCNPPAVTIGGARFNARLGDNTVSVTGSGSTGQPVSQSTPIKIACTRPAKKKSNVVPVVLVGAGVVALLTAGVLAERRNRRRLQST
jgi:hypothetical protein